MYMIYVFMQFTLSERSKFTVFKIDKITLKYLNEEEYGESKNE